MSDNFETANAERMAVYTENVKKIADYLYVKFYKTDQFDVYFDAEAEEISKGRCVDKAERLYQFFDEVKDVKRMVEFLNTVNPGLAKDMVDGL